VAAKALGAERSSVTRRILSDPELFALYGEQGEEAVVKPPTDRDTLLRSPKDIPEPAQDPKLGEMVIVTEKLIRGGLEKLGVPKSTIEKLRNFDGLGVNAGKFLAQSLQDTHQIYYLNLLKLDAMVEDIDRRYLAADATEAPDGMTRMFWQRARTEMVDQLGKGYDRMLSGTQAMVAMMKGAEKPAAPAKAKLGYQTSVPKSVSKG
jgi:hypothetical protein